MRQLTLRTTLASAALAAGLTPTAPAQCLYTTSLLDTFDRAGNPVRGDLQFATSGWTFHRADTGALLTGVDSPSWTAGGWGAAEQPFEIPLVGPRYSPIPARNQNQFYKRTPGFEGLFFHPGFAPIDAWCVLQPQAPVTLRGLTIHIEHLGSASPNAVVSAILQTAAGPVTLIPPTTVTSLAAALTLTPAPGLLPRAMSPSDRVVVIGNDGGLVSEDWLNLQVSAELDGPPLIAAQPRDVRACSGAEVNLTIVAAGATGYQWRREGVALPGQVADTLHFPSAGQADTGSYDCIIRNSCGEVTTRTITFLVCAADFNCDGLVDFSDYLEFLNLYDAQDPRADLNQDGLVDFSDYLEFLNLYDAGC